jgi:phospholipid/cholesterol/gamma-HCH transport system substrate-binding protein
VTTQIRKHLKDFLAVVGLLVLALVVAVFVLGHERLHLPAGVPFLGKDFYEVNAEMSTAQAVTPGQGQTVNIAGVEVGEIKSVKLVDGRAIVGLDIERKYAPIYRDATVLLRPKTGLKDMVAEVDPGHPKAGKLPEGGTIPISQTLPDVNLDQVLAELDADTRDYLRLLLADGAQGLKGNGRKLGQDIRRIEPTARFARQLNEALATRRENIKRVIHNFSLLTGELGRRDDQVASFVQNSNAVFAAFAHQDDNLKEILRQLPGTLDVTQTNLAKAKTLADVLGPTLQHLRPGARALGPTLRQVRPFVRQTTPVIRDEIRPFTRAALPTVRQLRPALNDLSAATPSLSRVFDVVNYAFNELAYNPPGQTNEGFLFWFAWINHLGPTVFSTQDAHGPIRRGLIVLSCNTAQTLKIVAGSNPLLGTLVQLLNAPNQNNICPTSSQEPGPGGG